jgi:pimeloyl-ACP methyl ester carboxylesterase
MPHAIIRRNVQPRPGLEIILREAGQGSPVLVLHGAPGPDSIAAIVDHLAIGHRVLAPTHPGWDDTGRPEALTTVTDLVDAYLDLLGAFGPVGVSVLGTSFGGWVASEMAVRGQGRRVSRLILIDAIGPEIPGHIPTVPGGHPLPPPPALSRRPHGAALHRPRWPRCAPMPGPP